MITLGNPNEMPLDFISEKVSDFYNKTLHELFKNTHKREIAEARQVFCYICRELTKYSQEKIGKYIGKYRGKDLDHATVRHAHIKIQGLLDYDKSLKNQIEILKTELNQYSNINIVVINVNLVEIAVKNSLEKILPENYINNVISIH